MSLTSSLADHFDTDPDPDLECEKLVPDPGGTLIRMWIQAKTIRIRIQAKTIRIRIRGNCTDSTNPDPQQKGASLSPTCQAPALTCVERKEITKMFNNNVK